MKNDVEVENDTEQPTTVLASEIAKVSAGMQKLLSGGLNRQGLRVLLKDATGVPFTQIDRILEALPNLAKRYTVPKKSNGLQSPKTLKSTASQLG